MPITEETRNNIFSRLKKNLEKYTPPLVVSKDSLNTEFEIIGNKPVPYGHDKKIVPGMYFASIANRKDSVAFYFFPLYLEAGLAEAAPTLTKYLKGKTCFHFKKEEHVNEKELAILMEKALVAWEKFGYMK